VFGSLPPSTNATQCPCVTDACARLMTGDGSGVSPMPMQRVNLQPVAWKSCGPNELNSETEST
jgi:hypothetical protein